MKPKKAHFLTALVIGLGLALINGVTGCTSGLLVSKLNHSPTGSDLAWREGNYTQPAYPSPTEASATAPLMNAPG